MNPAVWSVGYSPECGGRVGTAPGVAHGSHRNGAKGAARSDMPCAAPRDADSALRRTVTLSPGAGRPGGCPLPADAWRQVPIYRFPGSNTLRMGRTVHSSGLPVGSSLEVRLPLGEHPEHQHQQLLFDEAQPSEPPRGRRSSVAVTLVHPWPGFAGPSPAAP